jgi:kynurenine formamidase
MTKIIDLSVTIRNGSFDPAQATIVYKSHEEVGLARAKELGVSPQDFPNPNEHMANEVVTLSPHSGTHLDGSYHYGPTSEGRPATTVDEIPLEWCFGDGVVLDFGSKEPGEVIDVPDLEAELERIGYSLKPLDIVLIRTGNDRFFETRPDFVALQPGLTVEAVEWMLDRGIKVLGIDAFTIDRPIPTMSRELQAGQKEKFFPVHYLGRRREYFHAEKLTNLDKIPRPFGFKVALFPVKIHRASAGWCRAVAILDDED